MTDLSFERNLLLAAVIKGIIKPEAAPKLVDLPVRLGKK